LDNTRKYGLKTKWQELLHLALECIFHANSNLLLRIYEPWKEQFFLARLPNKSELLLLLAFSMNKNSDNFTSGKEKIRPEENVPKTAYVWQK
jgi:hypothetical protein